ncbi:hypothetical protein NHH03_23110 [Stieleria sp. TO1_6]|uniref:hypothetical protein n=1 Tax=Stieleria tagensis TaxID=2956795 RepID=UPI00209B5E9B|nr:hypothetical protein [Stieleria tagensis]MCO8124647.1 hypothetical protein [Stieleria tagensis]
MLESEPIKKLSFNSGFWGPKGSFPYYVHDGDDWGNVAKRDNWTDVKAFIRFNFQTDDPREVNWYLHRFVGCTKSSDGMNYEFSSGDRIRMSNGTSMRGHIFTRNRVHHVPPPISPHDQARDALVQTIQRYRSLFSSISFTMFGFRFRGGDLLTIKDYAEQGRMLVSHRPNQASPGIYYPAYDALHLKHKTINGFETRALIIHECAHAVMDLRYASLSTHQSEAIAYVVQCIVADYEGMVLYTPDKTHNLSTKECSGHDACKFVIGGQIASKVRSGTRTVSNADQKRMLATLTDDPHYGAKRGRPEYNGIPKRSMGPFPPVIPYGA